MDFRDDRALTASFASPRSAVRQALHRTVVVAVVASLVAALPVVSRGDRQVSAHAGHDHVLRYLGSEPSTLDPANANDAGTVQLHLQLYAGLTRLDEDVEPYPSLAESWEVSPDGLTYRFRLRDGLTFSDGSELDASDVRRSWIRLLDPETGSPAAALLADVAGATAFASGEADADAVQVRDSDPQTLEVTLAHPASYFPSLVATPATFVVPRDADASDSWADPDDFVGSGPYVVDSLSEERVELRGNPNYVAGAPSIDRITVFTELTDTEPATAFGDGELDLAPVPSWDAAWIRYDAALGESLHRGESLTVSYFAFDTTEPPFDDPRVRRAFFLALDRPRLVELAAASGEEPASSIVPPALWPDGMAADPAGDPEAARELLREAGYEDGAELGPITVSLGGFDSPGAAAAWEEELGVDLVLETMEFEAYFEALEEDPPDISTIGWVADYPSPQALYGLLLAPASASNYGRWNDPRFVELLEAAAAADDEAVQAEGYIAVDDYVDEQAPVIPYAYGEDWWLVRSGLRGARSLTIGLFDFGRLSWAE